MSWNRRSTLGAVTSAFALAGCGHLPRDSGTTRAALPAAAAGSLLLGGDMRVNRLGFGTTRILGPKERGEPTDPTNSRAILRRAVELGVNFIDTADIYGPYISERLIAETLHPYPKDLVIATKAGFAVPAEDGLRPIGTPAHLRASCEGSLRRLKLERIPLFQLHVPDPKVPITESVGELKRLQAEGKIRHIGLCNVPLAQLQLAQTEATVAAVQNWQALGAQGAAEVLAYCTRQKIAFVSWGPLFGRERAAAVAAARGISAEQAALAWLLALSPTMLPIPSTSSLQHLEQNIAAAAVRLSAEELAQLSDR
jgi:aryl-alcohol dehydrogenase-like predicted oxidoreductase